MFHHPHIHTSIPHIPIPPHPHPPTSPHPPNPTPNPTLPPLTPTPPPPQISQQLSHLRERRQDIGARWKEKMDWLQIGARPPPPHPHPWGWGGSPSPQTTPYVSFPPPPVLEVLMFGRDAGMAEAWLVSQEPIVRSAELGGSVAEVENLIKRHEGFQKAAAAWEERFAALERLTTVRGGGFPIQTPPLQ